MSLTLINPSPDQEARALRSFKRGEPVPAELGFAVAYTVSRGFIMFTPPMVGAGMFAVLSPVGRLRLEELAASIPQHARAVRLARGSCCVPGDLVERGGSI
jgi:hypothetical protein